MKTDAVLYTRVSSDEQRKSGFSLDYQEKQGRQYASKLNLNIVKIFSESYTAKKPGRPEFNKMLDFCKKFKIRHLIFLKSDRASRNGVDSATLVYMAEREEYNIHLIQDCLLLNKNSKPTDFLVFEINNCISNFYPRNLSIDVSTKMREKAEQGFYPSVAPIGYENKRVNRRSYLQIDPQKAPFIKRMFELYSTGEYSYSSLAKKMREEGFMISNKVKCGKRNIEIILNNPIYIGDFVWKGKRYFDAKHEPIISRELYSICQKVIRERQNTTCKKREFIYSNMIHCSKCGCYLVGELKKQKYIYYHCTGNRGGSCKKNSYIREEKIEKSVVETLKSFELPTDLLNMAKRALKQELENQNYYNEERIKSLSIDIEKAKSRLDKLFDLYLDGEISDNIYQKKKKQLENDIEEMSMLYSVYVKTGFELLKYSERMFELCKKASTLYLNGDVKEKREILKIVCSNLYYNGENVIISIKKAFQPLVKIASLQNLDCTCRNSNFLTQIRALIEELKKAETILFLEQFQTLKECA